MSHEKNDIAVFILWISSKGLIKPAKIGISCCGLYWVTETFVVKCNCASLLGGICTTADSVKMKKIKTSCMFF